MASAGVFPEAAPAKLRGCAIDFETKLFRQGLMAPPPISLCIAEEGNTPTLRHAVLDADGTCNILRAYLEWAKHGAERRIVGANIAYDMAVACERWPELLDLIFEVYELGRMSDVLIRQKLLDIALGENRRHGTYNLANIGRRLLAIELSGKEGKDGEDALRLTYGELEAVPLDAWDPERVTYAIEDGTTTRDAWRAQQKLVDEDQSDVLADEPAQCRAEFALHLASTWGLRTDPDGVERLRKGCLEELAKIRDGLVGGGLVRRDGTRNVRATQARMIEVCAAQGVKVRLTEGGQKARADDEPLEPKHVSTDEESCRDSGDPLLVNYAEYQTVSSLLNGHCKAMATGTVHPIHTRFDVLMETGRTSSSKPNVQNVRRAVGARECFIPREGWCFVGCDYDKAELHTLAQVCLWSVGRSRLAEALNNGLDPHLELGGKIAGVVYDEAKRRLASGDELMAEWRQRAKPANFGYPGGMGERGFVGYAKSQYGIDLDMAVAKVLRNGYFESWPEVSDFHGWVKHQLGYEGEGTIKHFVSGRYRGGVWFTAASNSFFQGLAADMAKAAMWQVSKACYVRGVDSRLFSCRIVNFVHDELILEVPLGREHEAAEALQEIMVRASVRYVPDVPARATAVASDRWSKKAKAVRDSAGRLQVWRYAA